MIGMVQDCISDKRYLFFTFNSEEWGWSTCMGMEVWKAKESERDWGGYMVCSLGRVMGDQMRGGHMTSCRLRELRLVN